jgi:hypothetical protein
LLREPVGGPPGAPAAGVARRRKARAARVSWNLTGRATSVRCLCGGLDTGTEDPPDKNTDDLDPKKIIIISTFRMIYSCTRVIIMFSGCEE